MDKKHLHKNEMMIEKYKHGRTCPVCKLLWEIEAFRFTPRTPFSGICNNCSKLVTLITANIRKQKADNTHCERRITSNKLQIKINELIKNNPNTSSIKIAKVIKGVELL